MASALDPEFIVDEESLNQLREFREEFPVVHKSMISIAKVQSLHQSALEKMVDGLKDHEARLQALEEKLKSD